MLYRVHLAMSEIRTHTTLMVVGTYCIGSYKSINHTIMAALILMVSIFLRTYHMLFYLLKSTSYYVWRFSAWHWSTKQFGAISHGIRIVVGSIYTLKTGVFIFFSNSVNSNNSKTLHLRYMFVTEKMALELLNFDMSFSVATKQWTYLQNTERGIRPWLGKTHTIRINGKKSNTGRTNATRLINVSS